MMDYRYPNAPSNYRGWGSGWPNCQSSRMVPLSINGVTFGSIRAEVHELLMVILTEIERRGYKLHAGQCFGYDCRATKLPGGGYSNTASNHSWGLAVDVNSLTNAYGGYSHDIPAWAVDLFHAYGFRWLGPAIRDWEHFDFCGTPTDAVAMTKKAKADLTGPHFSVSYNVHNPNGTIKRYRSMFLLGIYMRRRLRAHKTLPGDKQSILVTKFNGDTSKYRNIRPSVRDAVVVLRAYRKRTLRNDPPNGKLTLAIDEAFALDVTMRRVKT